jgi:hypothetical protein
MTNKITQKDRVLQYIKEVGYITRNDAATELGCHELASRIGELKDMGYQFNVETKHGRNRYGDLTHFAVYTRIREPKEVAE